MKAKKNFISLVRVLVKPEYQNKVIEKAKTLNLKWAVINPNVTLHGLAIQVFIEDCFEEYKPDDWNEYPKFKPQKDGIYLIRFDNGGQYIRRWKEGDWMDLTGTVRSRDCGENVKFKWYSENI